MEIEDVSRDVAIIFIIVAVVISLALISVVGFWHFGWGETYATLLLNASGVIASSLLISVYLITLIRDRREYREDREKWLMEDMISEVIEPSRDLLRQNSKRVEKGEVDWREHMYSYQLHKILYGIQADEQALERFEREFSELYNKLEKHDDEVHNEISRVCTVAVVELEEPLHDWIEENSITDKNGDPVNAKILSSMVINGGWGVSGDHAYSEVWKDHVSEIAEVADNTEPVDRSKLQEIRKDYIEYCEDVYRELGEAREEIRKEYPIPMD